MTDDSNLMSALQLLLTHKAGKQAFLDLQTETMQLSDTELQALADNPEFTERQKQAAIKFAKAIHRNEINVDSELQILLNNFEEIGNTDTKLAAWKFFADVILKAYYVPIYDAVVSETQYDISEPLTTFAVAYLQEFNGKLQTDKDFATKIPKLLFCVANYSDMTYQTGAGNQWYDKAEQFILDNGLGNTEEYAILLNLRGDEILSGFTAYNSDGSLNKFPDQSVDYLQRSLDLHKNIGSTLATTPHMRHVQLCLAKAKAQSLQYQFQITKQHTLEFKQSCKQHTIQILELLHTLYFVLGLDGPRIAECLQVEAQMYLLQGELSKAVELATAAILFIPDKPITQRANLLNNVGNIYVAMAYVIYKNIGNTESKIMMKQMVDHPSTQLAQKISDAIVLKITSIKDLLAVADNFVIMATACYVKSCQAAKNSEGLGHVYADQAKLALSQLGVDDDLINLVYFDQPIAELLGDIVGSAKLPDVSPSIDPAPSITSMFALGLQESLNNFKQLLMNVVYSPFVTNILPPP